MKLKTPIAQLKKNEQTLVAPKRRTNNLLGRKTGGLFNNLFKEKKPTYAYVAVLPNGFNGKLIYQLIAITTAKYAAKKTIVKRQPIFYYSEGDAISKLKSYEVVFYKLLPGKFVKGKFVNNKFEKK
ncbi:hypothetical protein C7N43_34600 [Sphingobacteriales bacterium UPWRP_1]|nr:hypothetical protein C7N43_34600 [Sphingobacteriales bacterium UPWRP_1]